jgi:hypothetical protein
VTALYKKHLNGDHVCGLFIMMILFGVLLINSSCIYVPIPANSLLSQKGVIPKDIIKSLKPGETTREELLLLVGEPDARYEQDRYFIYEWEVSEALVGTLGGGADVYIKHYFCVEFDEDNRIKRLEHIESGLIDRLYKNASEAQNEMYEWMSESEQ